MTDPEKILNAVNVEVFILQSTIDCLADDPVFLMLNRVWVKINEEYDKLEKPEQTIESIGHDYNLRDQRSERIGSSQSNSRHKS